MNAYAGVILARALRWTRVVAALGVTASACGASAPAPATEVRVEAQAQIHARVTVRLNCEAICRQIETACRQACRPQAWSPNMRSIADACERDCDFNRFSCVHDCAR